jgi:hypothetical protein
MNCISFEPNQWLGLPSSSDPSEPFISATEARTKMVTVVVKVSCCEQEQVINLTYMPGYPHKVSFLTPPDGQISVPEGDAIEPIALACLDEYGNRCAPSPQFGSAWYLRLDDNGPLLCPVADKFPVQADGVVTLKRLFAQVSSPGMQLVQSLYLDCSAARLGSQDTMITVKEEFCVTIVSGRSPEIHDIGQIESKSGIENENESITQLSEIKRSSEVMSDDDVVQSKKQRTDQ